MLHSFFSSVTEQLGGMYHVSYVSINRSGWVVLGGFGLRSVQVYNMDKSSFILLRSLFFSSSVSSL